LNLSLLVQASNLASGSAGVDREAFVETFNKLGQKVVSLFDGGDVSYARISITMAVLQCSPEAAQCGPWAWGEKAGICVAPSSSSILPNWVRASVDTGQLFFDGQRYLF